MKMNEYKVFGTSNGYRDEVLDSLLDCIRISGGLEFYEGRAKLQGALKSLASYIENNGLEGDLAKLDLTDERHQFFIEKPGVDVEKLAVFREAINAALDDARVSHIAWSHQAGGRQNYKAQFAKFDDLRKWLDEYQTLLQPLDKDASREWAKASVVAPKKVKSHVEAVGQRKHHKPEVISGYVLKRDLVDTLLDQMCRVDELSFRGGSNQLYLDLKKLVSFVNGPELDEEGVPLSGKSDTQESPESYDKLRGEVELSVNTIGTELVKARGRYSAGAYEGLEADVEKFKQQFAKSVYPLLDKYQSQRKEIPLISRAIVIAEAPTALSDLKNAALTSLHKSTEITERLSSDMPGIRDYINNMVDDVVMSVRRIQLELTEENKHVLAEKIADLKKQVDAFIVTYSSTNAYVAEVLADFHQHIAGSKESPGTEKKILRYVEECEKSKSSGQVR